MTSHTLFSAAFTALTLTSILSAKELPVSFDSKGSTLVGTLYLPETPAPEGGYPALVVTGAWTTVKEQMPATYAKEMAKRGFAALVFDFRGWGASKDDIRYLENPVRKTEDILAAAAFLASREDLAKEPILGLGICASAGYMIDAANQSPHMGRVALVAPWLHDAAIVAQVYGGEEGVQGLIQLGRDAEASDQPVYQEAASSTNELSLMYQAPYYTEKERGAIPAYDNQFNVASWEGWLSYDAQQAAGKLKAPVLLVHSDAAAIPQGAKQFARDGGEWVRSLWLPGVSQFDFYDRPEPVTRSADAVAAHFRAEALPTTQDEAAIRSHVEAVGLLADLGAFDLLERIYAEQVLVDYASLNGQEAALKSNKELMKEWAAVLPGFERTRHAIRNIQVYVNGEEASATADVVADHWVNGQHWRVAGSYEYEFKRTEQDWKITLHRVLLEEEQGTRDVFGPAMERAKADPSPYLR